MPTLTPEFAGTTMVYMIIGYVLALLFQLYMLYLNYKQAKVKDTTSKMIDVLYEIRNIMDDVRSILNEDKINKVAKTNAKKKK